MHYNELNFKNKLNAALLKVKTILDNTRSPQIPSDVSHCYDDKYLLSEFIGNTSFAGQLNCLEALGLDKDGLSDLCHWAKERTVSLRLISEERCTFDRKTERKEESKTQHVTEVKRAIGTTKVTHKTVTKITEYFWKFEVDYELFAFQGNNMKKKLVLQNRHASCEIKTSSDSSPKPKVSIIDPIDINITFLLKQINESGQLKFSINREDKSCHTPRRNNQVTKSLSFLSSFYSWCSKVIEYFHNRLFPVQSNHGLDFSIVNDNEIFIPVIPLFEEKSSPLLLKSNNDKNIPSPSNLFSIITSEEQKSDDGNSKPPSTLNINDINLFLGEQIKSISEKFKKLEKTFAKEDKLITLSETKIIVILHHIKTLCDAFNSGVNHIEQMLRNQLISAIGKELTPVDFTNYMSYHNRKLFKDEYQPQQFCYAIRRPDHYPEGIVSIDCKLDDGSVKEPIYTIVNRQKCLNKPMKFNLNAASTVSFFGDRYIHSWMGHQFQGDSGADFSLSARARQFSSFIILIGNITGPNLFDPKYATIVQNKDDIIVPLLFEQIPTPQAFRDAIESLSPEQQDFAKAFRSMQLESTMFGICIIQIKPQLEKLLNLTNDSLTKEIQLTQDLLELFIQYQIPSDLLSFDADDYPNASTEQKINIVKGHVKTMMNMIEKSKDKELAEAKQKTEYDIPILEERTKEIRKVKKKSVKYKKKRMKSVRETIDRSAVNSKPGTAVLDVPEVPKPKESSENQVDENKESSNEFDGVGDDDFEGIDVTKLPSILDEKFDKMDEDNALHSTIIKPSSLWHKKYLKALLAKPSETTLGIEELRKEKNKTFDLLDALTRSGALPIDDASLHVVLASTHCFDETLVNTIIQKNMNPIEKIERSTLIIASTIQQVSPEELIKDDQLDRVKEFSPILFG